MCVSDPKEARDTDVAAIAALDEPTRRRLYDHVVRQGAPVSRDEAFELGRALGSSFASLLDELVLDVQGTHVTASLMLGAEVLEELRAKLREAAEAAARTQSLGPP